MQGHRRQLFIVMALVMAAIYFYAEFDSIEELLSIPPGARLDHFVSWRLRPEKGLTVNEFAAFKGITSTYITSSPPHCNKNASVAVCMMGTRLELRARYNLSPSYKTNVLSYLGGATNVDMFLNYGPGDRENESDLGETWPHADRVILDMSFSDYTFRCPRNTRPLQRNVFGLTLRLESCLSRIQAQEKRCGHRYQWVMRDRPDIYHNEPVFGGKSIEDLDPAKIYAPCLWKDWGVCDNFAMVPRSYAQAYYNYTASIPTLCVPNSLMSSTYTCKPTKMPWDGPIPECALSMQLINAGVDLDETVVVTGQHSLTNIVRNCICDNGDVVMPSRYFGPRTGYCGQSIPGAQDRCDSK